MNAIVRRTRKPIPIREATGPTMERLAKADGNFVVGDDEQGTKIYTIDDSPLGKIYKRKAIDGPAYAALLKYRNHWYCAGLSESVSSMDLNRVFSSDLGSFSGMARTEAQAYHRQQYRAGRELLGHRAGIVVDNIVCAERTLEIAGYSVGGWKSKPQAIAAATEMLRDAGYRLGRHWGMI